MKSKCSCLAVLVAGIVLFASPQVSPAQKYGHFAGQFVLDGEMPEIAARQLGPQDKAVCSPDKPLPENTLIVNPENKGIKNIVVYLKKAPSQIHPKLKRPAEKTLVFDQENCRFEPHVMLVRTDQTVQVKNSDPINHNTHIIPFRNKELNFLVRPNDQEGVPVEYKQPEFIPTTVKCDLHPHMRAYWLILDHPYMAVTDEDGKFKIENLPEGDYEFTVWHERVGYISRDLKAEIFADDTDDKGKIPVPASKIKTE